MRQKVHPNIEKEKKKNKIVREKNSSVSIKGQKIRNHNMAVDSDLSEKKTFFWKDKFTRKNITYFVLFLFDAILAIYMARENVVHYVEVANQNIFVSQTKNLLLGRNYITLVITGFFYVYFCFVHRFFLREKITKKFLIWSFLILLVFNCLLFILFTKRIY